MQADAIPHASISALRSKPQQPTADEPRINTHKSHWPKPVG
jgi:hypothetical protein